MFCLWTQAWWDRRAYNACLRSHPLGMTCMGKTLKISITWNRKLSYFSQARQYAWVFTFPWVYQSNDEAIKTDCCLIPIKTFHLKVLLTFWSTASCCKVMRWPITIYDLIAIQRPTEENIGQHRALWFPLNHVSIEDLQYREGFCNIPLKILEILI